MKKKIVLIIIGILFLIITALFIYREQKVSVLGYHSFVKDELHEEYNDAMIMNIDKFEDQLKFLKINNYKTLTLEEFYCWKQGTCEIPRKSVMITMDDGYASNYHLAFPLLKEYNMNAVVFYVGSYIDSSEFSVKDDPTSFMTFKEIEKSKEEYPNIEFASHSFNLHYDGAVETLTKEELNADITKYKKLNDSNFFAYPFGHHNANIINALEENDYKMAFTFGPDKEHRKATKKDHNFKIPRLNISGDMSILKFIARLLMPF